MKGPIISVDVSNGTSHFQGFIDQDKAYGSVRKIIHDVEGFSFFLKKLHELQDRTGEEVKVVYESTGVYTKPLQRFLEKNHIKQYVISPLQSAKQRQTQIHSKKTDKSDPRSIAAVYYSKQLREYKEEEEIYHKMRAMNRHYEDKLEHLRKYKVTFQCTLSNVFPGYMKLFKDGYSDISLTILKYYPHPDILKNKKVETVAKRIEKHCKHTYEVCLKYASKVVELANRTYPGCEKEDYEVDILLSLIRHIEETNKELDGILSDLIELAQQLPNYHLLLSIDGIGPNLASRILAELGNISRFESRESLVAYVGVDPNIYQSGQMNGLHYRISKKGNKRLRCLLYLAVTCNLRLKKDNPIKEFYQKKRQQPNPLNSKAAKIACVTKLIRTMFSMCNSGTIFMR